jgi:hypothetical protein
MEFEKKLLQGSGAPMIGRNALLICRSSKNFIKFLLFLSFNLILFYIGKKESNGAWEEAPTGQ